MSSAAVGDGGYGAIEGAPAVSGLAQTPVDRFSAGTKANVAGQSEELPPWMRYGLRVALVAFTGVCATSVPNFGVVVSLLGSFSVTLGSFVLPPLFHLIVFAERLTQGAIAVDVVLFVLGVVTCIFTTMSTALGVINGDT